MSYPVSSDQINDPWVRGKVDMFAKLVEYQNDYPSRVDDAVIEELHKEVEGYCELRDRRSVVLTIDGTEITK